MLCSNSSHPFSTAGGEEEERWLPKQKNTQKPEKASSKNPSWTFSVRTGCEGKESMVKSRKVMHTQIYLSSGNTKVSYLDKIHVFLKYYKRAELSCSVTLYLEIRQFIFYFYICSVSLGKSNWFNEHYLLLKGRVPWLLHPWNTGTLSPCLCPTTTWDLSTIQ